MKTSIKMSVLACAVAFVACSKENVVSQQVNDVSQLEEVASITLEDSISTNRTVVFITGYDKGNTTFYSDAKTYFSNQEFEIVESAYSIQEIILWLNINYNNIPFNDIHIVSHNKWKDLPLETTIKGPNVSSITIHESIHEGVLPKLNDVLKTNARFVFHASNIGSDVKLINGFKKVFKTSFEPKIVATDMVSIFGGEYTSHYLAKPYYAFYPTANSPGRVDLAKQFSRSYQNADIDWLSAMNNHVERYQGDIYSYKFNIPVQWEFDFMNDDEIPNFKNLKDLHAWMLNNDEIAADLKQIGVPIEKYRLYETVRGDRLIIKGKVTGVCVLEPLMSHAYPSEYMIPNIDNLRLYDTM